MDATQGLIDSDADPARAHNPVDRLSNSEDPADIARLQAQARLIAAYKESKWPRRSPSTAELVRHLMDQHGVTRADRSPSWERRAASAKSRGKNALSMAVQRLCARFRVLADFLIPPAKVTGRAPKPARPMADPRTAIRGQRE